MSAFEEQPDDDRVFPSILSTAELCQIKFREGLKQGIRLCSWWREGRRFVGACGSGRALEAVLTEVDAGKHDHK